MTLREQTEKHASAFLDVMKDIKKLFPEDFEYIEDSIPYTEPFEEDWKNYRFRSSVFRLAHIEVYTDGRYSVLHVTCFPQTNIPAPIFGFDLVGIDRLNKYTASFFDLSPTTNISDQETDLFPSMGLYPYRSVESFGKTRVIPEWGDIFSQYFVCIEPEMEYIVDIVGMASACFRHLIYALYYSNKYNHDLIDRNEQRLNEIMDNQRRYCEMQSQNKKTFSVLKSKVGKENASLYMKEVLFPKP